ncbi:hypothetical protein EVAR_53003_1 [Eumeta japonica]|uniref:Uncharacterized protein n=1 Tax=Eumeta variegata TaxID=151549 RepID=A0A4C1YNY4_EUMVA|nr:hypothetical protein EVAR_53003_1 [Eumeta japonica]
MHLQSVHLQSRCILVDARMDARCVLLRARVCAIIHECFMCCVLSNRENNEASWDAATGLAKGSCSQGRLLRPLTSAIRKDMEAMELNPRMTRNRDNDVKRHEETTLNNWRPELKLTLLSL